MALVASGINLNVTEEDLENFLKSKDIDVVNVELLTKEELLAEKKVRSKTMKVNVKAKDHEKAMCPEIWPFRVGVRYYRAESRKPGGAGLVSRGPGVSQKVGPGSLHNQQNRHQPRDSQTRPPPGSTEWGNMRNEQGRQDQEVDYRNLYSVLNNPKNQELLRQLENRRGP